MQVTIPLDKMTIADKLRVMEDIWEDLARTPEEVPSPTWHADVLRAREERVREGTAHFGDWNDAKSRIRNQAS
jgi:hypothetical protein